MKSKGLISMYETFISIIVPLSGRDHRDGVVRFLENVRRDLVPNFSDYEIILVDNRSGIDFSTLELIEDIRSNCYIVKLAGSVPWDQAVLAGLERANGDYSASFDVAIADNVAIISDMYRAAVEGADIVHLRDRRLSTFSRFSRRGLFFWLLRVTGAGLIDARDRREILISRRALNWVVRDQSAHWYLNDALLSSGFRLRALEVELPTVASPRTGDSASLQAWSTLVRSSRFLSLAARMVIGSLLLVLAMVVLNTLMVRFFGRDIFWQEQIAVPGWTYIVLLLAAGLTGICILLYVIVRIQFLILGEVQSRPRYIVEHFGRI